MKFTTITTAAAMQKMKNFIIACPTEKLTYAKKRFQQLGYHSALEMSDEDILSALKFNESNMQAFIQQYEAVKDTPLIDLPLDTRLLSLSNSFINTAVPPAIELILATLDDKTPSPACISQHISTHIGELFNDREHLREKLRLILSLIQQPMLQSEIIYTDLNTFRHVYQPITSPDATESEETYGLAFLDLMGVELCILINQPCFELNARYAPKIAGFQNEFYLYTLLHELTHLLIGSNDDSYNTPTEETEDINLYSTANLKPHEIDNADNYCTLIFITLALMHKQGCLDLTQF